MIHLPQLFESKLATNPELAAAVRQNLNLFEPWLEQSGMPFFPGFTDHSPRHINDVLRTAASLMSDSSHDLVSAEDVAVLCIAILLHDCGMHLTQDGFRALITTTGGPVITGLDDLPWPELWAEFLSEARRFGQDRLSAIFGDTEPFQVDELDFNDLGERDCLLIGEFVRRHHSRLAHEIALKGVPTKSANALELMALEPDFRDLAGLVARSHGMPIRDAFPYIENKYGVLREYRRIKPPFLMAVLRIADYVQVQSERALKSLMSVKELRSPISRQEWSNHFAVKDISYWHDDPEALFVNAAPTDVRTYLKLNSLFKDIQRELDESWATLGEVYGRFGGLAQLGLTWRRIRSTLDDKDHFSRTVPYIPIRAGFDSSGPELLKLLVGPLYDYKFEVGIRELVQNAVDACRELADMGIAQVTEETTQRRTDPAVIVDIQESEDGTGWVTISDQGVGMTIDTITRYFLVAGASFRNSDIWKQQHMDESGRVRVMRGGRFGVGALAAFLLGEELTVRTRHVSRPESEGLEFRARIDDPMIELRRCPASVGTSIRVWVSNPKIIDKLRPYKSLHEINDPDEVIRLDSWQAIDWFVQSSPRVIYRWDGYQRSIYVDAEDPRVRFRAEFYVEGEQLVPSSGDSIWHELIDPKPYKAILWRYRKPQRRKNDEEEIEIYPPNEITVNGIRVQGLGPYSSSGRVGLSQEALGSGPNYWLERPSMAIFDPAGLCPINLQRSAISFDRMGVDERLGKALLEDHLRQIADSFRSCATLSDFKKECAVLKGRRSGIRYEGQTVPICATASGFFLASPETFSELGIESLLFVDSEAPPDLPLSSLLRSGEAMLMRVGPYGVQANLAWFRGILAEDNEYGWYKRNAGLPLIERSSATFAMPATLWRLANEKGRVNQQILRTLQALPDIGEHKLVASGDPDEGTTLAMRAKELLAVLDGNAWVASWELVTEQDFGDKSSLLHQVWIETFGGAYIRPLGANKS